VGRCRVVSWNFWYLGFAGAMAWNRVVMPGAARAEMSRLIKDCATNFSTRGLPPIWAGERLELW